ncbi:MAG TPA: hypothetical protein VIW07_02420 [Candidatus Udaeobacter sp.]
MSGARSVKAVAGIPVVVKSHRQAGRNCFKLGLRKPLLLQRPLSYSRFCPSPLRRESRRLTEDIPGGNTAEGQAALFSLSTGQFNTAVVVFSPRSDTVTSFNAAVGAAALLSNTAEQNTATGVAALLSNTSGTRNTANGAFTLFSNGAANGNTAIGQDALFSNTKGGVNIAGGVNALTTNTTGA